MQLRWLGTAGSQGGGSPTLFDTDEQMNDHDVYVIQGWKVTDPDTLASLDVPDHETVIAVPKRLMDHLPKDSNGAITG